MIDRCLEYLANKPVIGIAASFGSSAISFCERSSFFLKFAGIIIGLIVGVLTAYKLLIQIKNEKMTSKTLEKINKN